MPDPEAPSRSAVATRSGITLDHFDHGVSELVIDRFAQRNALSSAVLDEIVVGLEKTVAVGNRIIILRGSNGFFSAGADVTELTGMIADQEHDAKVAAVVDALTNGPVVSIAAVERGCIGAGLELAAACDVRIADSTTFFAFPALEMGLVYRPAALSRTVRLVGPAAATRMLILGERLMLDEAYQCGLVTTTAFTGDVYATARTLADRLSGVPSDVLRDTARILSSVLAGSDEPDRWMNEHLESFASLSRYESVTAKKNAMKK
ncbi:enoyl-CoA hydratase/isomerase family protein [Rhodococcus sp. NPDC057529]|uniref:enoyl-CoA hydratase/isomerase family protein n=1 Tax=Rhodococcus sp. NPDC057529 TaxID=3346158 RepID=UPI00366B89BF